MLCPDTDSESSILRISREQHLLPTNIAQLVLTDLILYRDPLPPQNNCNYYIKPESIWSAFLQAMELSTMKAMNISSLLEVVSLPHQLLRAAVKFCSSHTVTGYKTAIKGFACITQGLLLISSCAHRQQIKPAFFLLFFFEEVMIC